MKINDFSAFNTNRKKYLTELEEDIAKRLKKSRYRHTLGVAHTSACLAMRYGADVDEAYLAGLLHDIAKHLDGDSMLKLAKKNKLKLNKFEKDNPFILHGPVGACIAQSEYRINNNDILNAIANHTTGRPEMSLLEKIVFIADYIEQGRDAAENLAIVRPLAFENIDECLIKILIDTISYLNSNNMPIDDRTKTTAEYYMGEQK